MENAPSDILGALEGLNLYSDLREIIDSRDVSNSVSVRLNSDSMLSQKSTESIIVDDMAKIYQALYQGNPYNLERVRISSNLITLDQYGNEKDEIFYQTEMDATTAANINWDANEALLHKNIIPGLWELQKNRLDSINW